jgi:hypothetical protein
VSVFHSLLSFNLLLHGKKNYSMKESLFCKWWKKGSNIMKKKMLNLWEKKGEKILLSYSFIWWHWYNKSTTEMKLKFNYFAKSVDNRIIFGPLWLVCFNFINFNFNESIWLHCAYQIKNVFVCLLWKDAYLSSFFTIRNWCINDCIWL